MYKWLDDDVMVMMKVGQMKTLLFYFSLLLQIRMTKTFQHLTSVRMPLDKKNSIQIYVALLRFSYYYYYYSHRKL